MPSATVLRVVRKRLCKIPYELHMLQNLKDTDKSAREDLYTKMQEMKNGFDDCLVFSDGVTFRVVAKSTNRMHAYGELKILKYH